MKISLDPPMTALGPLIFVCVRTLSDFTIAFSGLLGTFLEFSKMFSEYMAILDLSKIHWGQTPFSTH